MAYNSYFFKDYKMGEKDGDTLFLNLYYFNNKRKESFTEKEKQLLYNLKGKAINDLPIIGSFCRGKCILEDVKYFTYHVDYRFNFEKEAIKVLEGRPVKVISNLIIEGRYYFKKGIAAVLVNGEIEEKSALSIMYTLEDYIKLSLHPGLEFTYTVPKYKELLIEKLQMELISGFLRYKLRASELDGDVDKVRSIKLDGFTSRFQDESNLLKVFSPKVKIKILEFYYKDLSGKKQKISISENGKLFSTILLEQEAFEEIVELIYVIQNCTIIKEFLIPVESIIDEYCSFVHKGMIEEARCRQRVLICDEFKELVEQAVSSHFGEKHFCRVVYLNTAMNVLIKLCQDEKRAAKIDCLEENQFLYLTEFLQLYVRKKFNIDLKEKDIQEKFQSLNNLIGKTDMDQCRLIEALKVSEGNLILL